MSAKHVMLLIVILATWMLAHRRAEAGSGLLVVSGGAAEHQRSAVGTAIEAAIRKAGWSLPAKPLTKKDSDGLLSCTDSKSPWTCLPASYGSARDVHDVLVVSVDMQQAENGAPMVIITGKMIVTDPPAFAVLRRYCEHCADDKLVEAGQSLTEELIRQIATRSGRTIVSIRSVPAPAAIIFDGVRAGATDATFNTFPGTHLVIIERAGFLSETREFTVEEGKTAEVTFNLQPSATRSTQEPPKRDWLVPAILLGTGVPVTVFGAISIYRGQVNGSGGKFDYRRATALGVTSSIIGLGAIGTAVYLVWRDSARSAPSAGLTPGGAIVGWTGSF